MTEQTTVRIDKWLWAARFFKTRSLAKQAIEGGKVQYNGQRVKTSKLVEINAEIQVRCGWDEKIIQVTAISDQRRGAPEASKLYCETDASIKRREAHAAQRKAMGAADNRHPGKPSKKQRRQIHRFKQSTSYSPEPQSNSPELQYDSLELERNSPELQSDSPQSNRTDLSTK